jgi:hypothetical protein
MRRTESFCAGYIDRAGYLSVGARGCNITIIDRGTGAVLDVLVCSKAGIGACPVAGRRVGFTAPGRVTATGRGPGVGTSASAFKTAGFAIKICGRTRGSLSRTMVVVPS